MAADESSNVPNPTDLPEGATLEVDVAVIGGSAAGLAASLMLARSLRSVAVIDAGDPRNAPSAHMHGYLSRDGMSPADFVAAGRAEVAGYGVELVDGRVRTVDGDVDHGFTVEVEGGGRVRARRLVVATGLTDVLPSIPGLAERWGRDVLHCPYCHGYEVRGSRVVVLATSPMAAHAAGLFRQLTEHLTVVVHEADGPGAVDRERLSARGVEVLDGPVAEIVVEADRITGVRLSNGEVVPADAVVVGPRFEARAGFLEGLGLVPVEHEMGIGTHVPSEAFGASAVPGVWLAGNVTDPMQQVSHAAAAGSMAGAIVNADLVREETDDAVAHARHDGGVPVMDRAFWEERYGSEDRIWSGDPNPQLVAEAAGLEPGRAIDVGAGEGADAIWLATQGWQVTAFDISQTALDKGAAEADALGAELAGRLTWRQCDLVDGWDVAPRSVQLVSAQFMHLPPEQRIPLYRRLAEAVAEGGRLLIVGHDFSDREAGAPRPNVPSMYFTAEQLVGELGAGWEIEVADRRPREAVGPDGAAMLLHDAVLVARRT